MPTRSRFIRVLEAQPGRWCRLLPLLAALAWPASVVAEAFAEWREPGSGIVFVQIPGGCFEQGESQAGPMGLGILIQWPREDELPRRRVCVDDFWLAKTEVTIAQWSGMMTPSTGGVSKQPNRPQADVSWEEAQNFVATMNRRSTDSGARFRLPSEAEWEYACQAGQKPPAPQYHGEERAQLGMAVERQACFALSMKRDPHACEVAGRLPNAWGVHDMLGNVWEWVEDRYTADAYRRPLPKATAASGGDVPRVIRGGSYKSDLAQVRCGVRNFAPTADRSMVIGLRLLMERGKK